MHSFKTTIKDYQIIKKANLEFRPGLTVIIGPSNNGKTSIFKALKANMYTVPGSTPIRVGQSSYAVGIQYNEHTVILQKSNKDSVYLIDGEKYTKFGTTTPEAVSKALNIKELTLNGNKEQLNFWDQMNYPFLLDRTAVELFRFIIDSGDDDQISKALKNMVSDRQQISKDINILQGSINSVDNRLNSLKEDLDKSKSIIDAANSIIDLQVKVAKLNSMKFIKTSLDNIKQNEQLVKPKLDKSKIEFDNLEQLNYSLNLLNQRYNILSDILIKLDNIIGSESDINERLVKINRIFNIDLSKTSKLFRMKEIFKTINYINDRKNELEKHPHDFYDINIDEYRIKLNSLKEISRNLDLINEKNIENSKTLENIDVKLDEIIKLKGLFDICPVCGSTIKHNHK